MKEGMIKIVIIDESLCIGCGACVKLCPKEILYIDKATQKCKIRDESKCDRLRGCEKACPVDAIKIVQGWRIKMKIGIIISSNDAETCWNALRYANFCLGQR